MKRMLGVKVYDSSFCTPAHLDRLQELGFNTVFLGRGVLKSSVTEDLSRRGLFWNIVEPVFLVDEDESCSLATLKDGSPAEDDWVRFACPTDPVHMNHVMERIRSDIQQFNPPGVSLDFIRFFQFWEMTLPSADPSQLPRACFCSRCRDSASSFDTYMHWRENVVNATATKLCSLARSMNEDLKIGIHAVPWTRTLFDGARMEILGQDFRALATIADYITPMVYHHMMHMPVPYIKELLADMAGEGRTFIVPSIQSKEAYRKDSMSPSEFSKALETALDSPSKGVLIYKWEDLSRDEKRLGIVKDTFKGLDR